MEVSLRPWYTTGVALVGAGAIAMAPIAPIAPSASAADIRAATTAISAEFTLAALDIPYILTLPIARQLIRNWAENWAVYLAGLGKSGVGLAQSLLSIPGVTVEIIQEVLTLNFVGAFDTLASAVRDSVVAVGQPLLDSLIWRNQKALAVQTALQAAVPQAFIDVTNGFLAAGSAVTTSLILGTQELVAAILTLNLGNIVDAAVDGTKNFIVALGDGAGAIIDGIEAAQSGIAAALATPPPPSPSVADVSALRTSSVDSTFSLVRSSSADTPDAVDDAPSPAELRTAAVDSGSEPMKAAAAGDAEPVGVEAEVSPSTDIAPDATALAPQPKKRISTSAVTEVPKITAGVEDGAGVKDSTEHDKAAGDTGNTAGSAPNTDDE